MPENELAKRYGSHQGYACVKHIRPGEVYRDATADLQLPDSHLAFRIPENFTGRLSPGGAFKIFSADRAISCFVFVHGTVRPVPNNWMNESLTLEGETLVAAGPEQHAQSDTVFRAFESKTYRGYKFQKTNRRGSGLHGSAAALQAEADKLTSFIKKFLSTLRRGERVDAAAPAAPPPPAVPPPPVATPAATPARLLDPRLFGRWCYMPTLRSGSASMSVYRYRYFSADGHFAQGSESFATFVHRDSGGQQAGMNTWQSEVPPGERGQWKTSQGVLTLNYDDDMYSEFRYQADADSILLTTERGGTQLWTRG